MQLRKISQDSREPWKKVSLFLASSECLFYFLFLFKKIQTFVIKKYPDTECFHVKNVKSVFWKCAITGFASYSYHQEPTSSGICSVLASLSNKDYIIHAVIQTIFAKCVWLGFPVTAVVYRCNAASDLKHSKKIQGLTHKIPTKCKPRSEEYLRKCPHVILFGRSFGVWLLLKAMVWINNILMGIQSMQLMSKYNYNVRFNYTMSWISDSLVNIFISKWVLSISIYK